MTAVEHTIVSTEESDDRGFPSVRWCCSCGQRSRPLQLQHLQRSHSQHATSMGRRRTW